LNLDNSIPKERNNDMKHILTVATAALTLFALPALAASTTPDPAVTAPAAAVPAAGNTEMSAPKVVVPDTTGPADTASTAGTAPPDVKMAPADATAPVLWYTQSKEAMRASKLIGSAVQNPAGETIGDVNEVLLDSNGKVNAVVVGVGGFLGMGEREVAIAFGALHMTRSDDGRTMIMIDATKDTLKAAPVWTWPNA
jgi:sporulation protein YlmC with PRC-barrel domain